MDIAREVCGHLEQVLAETESAVQLFPDELWERPGEEDMLCIPAFLAHHTVWCMSLSHLLAIPKEEMPHNIYPDYSRERMLSKEQVLALVDDVRAHVRKVYAHMSDEDYLNQGDRQHVPLGAVMYTIAHTRHHQGELVQILKEHGIKPPGWYPLR